MPNADLPTRLAEAAQQAHREFCHRRGMSWYYLGDNTYAEIARALLNTLADTAEEEVWAAADAAYGEAYMHCYGGPLESRRAGLRAATPLLLARQAGEMETLREELAQSREDYRQLSEWAISERARVAGRRAQEGGMIMWQPIETAPKDGTHVLLCRAIDADGDPILDDAWGLFIQVASWSDLERWVVFVDYDDPPLHFIPTHWMPLPPNPLARPSAPAGEEGKAA